MRVKVINAKNIFNNFVKIVILLIIICMFGQFFYKNRKVNVVSYIKSARFTNIIGKEIALIGNKNDSNEKLQSKFVINEEMSVIKVATNNCTIPIGVYEQNEISKIEEYEDEAKPEETTILPPEERSKYRSFSICNSGQVYI